MFWPAFRWSVTLLFIAIMLGAIALEFSSALPGAPWRPNTPATPKKFNL